MKEQPLLINLKKENSFRTILTVIFHQPEVITQNLKFLSTSHRNEWIINEQFRMISIAQESLSLIKSTIATQRNLIYRHENAFKVSINHSLSRKYFFLPLFYLFLFLLLLILFPFYTVSGRFFFWRSTLSKWVKRRVI